MLNDRVEAEDVMQDAFLTAFLKLDQYRGEMSFGSWLKRIVINKSIDVLRSKKIRFEELDEKQEDEYRHRILKTIRHRKKPNNRYVKSKMQFSDFRKDSG